MSNSPSLKNSFLQNGWLIVDKPLGMSSAQVVGAVKKLLKPNKIGHGGTLDPLASGILPLALNEATKTFQFVVNHTKTYRFTVCFGEERTTDDAEGEICASSINLPSREAIETFLPQFTGTVMQVPPAFSAIKVAGERAYAKARAGEDVTLEARPVTIERLTLLSIDDARHATFEMRCGAGTYVRSVARDLGRLLGCYGYVSFLRRVEVGKFSEKNAISLEKLKELVHSGARSDWLLSMPTVLDDIPAVEIGEEAATGLRQGKIIQVTGLSLQEGEKALMLKAGKLVAVTVLENGAYKPVRVFNDFD